MVHDSEKMSKIEEVELHVVPVVFEKCPLEKISILNQIKLWLSSRPLWPWFVLEEQPQQRVKFILGDECDEEHMSHEVFTELEELTVGEDGEEQTWKEMAR